MVVLIDNDVTRRVLDMADALRAIEDAFEQLGREDATFYPRTDLVSPTADGGDYYAWGGMLGAIRRPPRLAFRFKSDVLHWQEHEGNVTEEKFNVEPGTFMGFVLLFDTTNGELLGLINDGALQHVRVGATAGVACNYLAREDASAVGILGSGGMARAYLRAFDVVRDVEVVKVHSPTEGNRLEFAEEMSDELRIDVRAVDNPEAAMTGVDIAATCTDASQPIYDSAWLEPGQFLVDVRSTEIDRNRLDGVDRTYITTTKGFRTRMIGSEDDRERYQSRRGQSSFERREHPTLDEVIAYPSTGRKTDEEAIYYHNRSSAIQFASVGNLVYENATDAGLGTAIPLDWFQQGIRN